MKSRLLLVLTAFTVGAVVVFVIIITKSADETSEAVRQETGSSTTVGRDGLPLLTGGDEMTADEWDTSWISDYRISVYAPGTLSLQSGMTTSYDLVISNSGKKRDNYIIRATSKLGWVDLSGIPSSLALKAGKSVTLSIPVKMPEKASGVSEDEITVSIQSETHKALRDSTTTWIQVSE